MGAPKRRLRKAGVALQKFDRNYAEAIRGMPIYGRTPNPEDNSRISALNTVKGFAGLLMGGLPAQKLLTDPGSTPPNTRLARIGEAVIDYGAPSVSTAVRYGAPAAGVAVAGQGVMGIINAMSANQQSEGAVMPQ